MTPPEAMTTITRTAGATAALAEFACRPRDRSPRATSVARALVDTVGVAVAGAGTEPVRRLTAWSEGEPSPGPAAVWGTPRRCAPSRAALLNGTAAHALDWDDASPSMPMHPGAVLFPALLAQAAISPADGATLVAAFDIGSAVFRAVSEVLPVGVHYGRGWHNTATSGRLAAVAALAHLSRLRERETRHALGLAASLAGGSLANFGTMTKPLHAGLAARDAVMAVGLAARGFTANEHQLEADRGFFDLFGERDRAALAALPDRLEAWESRWVEDWAVKRYPSCYATHRPIDAVLALREEAGGPDGVAAIEVTVRTGGLRPLIDHLPATGLEGKFSLEYTVVLALVRGEVRLADFTDEAVAASDVRAVLDRVVVAERGAPEGGAPETAPFAEVRIRRHDGGAVSRRVDVTYGDARNPLTDDDLDAKFLEACTSGGWPAADARALAATLRGSVTAPTLDEVQRGLLVPGGATGLTEGGDR